MENWKMVVALSFENDYSPQKISMMTGVKIAQVYKIISNARNKNQFGKRPQGNPNNKSRLNDEIEK